MKWAVSKCNQSRETQVNNMAASFPSSSGIGKDSDDDQGERRSRKRIGVQDGDKSKKVKRIHLQDNE